MKNLKTLQILNILGFLLVIILNTLAVTLPIGGNSTGEIADLYPNLFVPAGYAFSIWSLIYLLLLIFIILQSKGLFSSEKQAPGFVQAIGWWFLVSCFANSAWILAWHYLMPGISVLLMLVLLFSLIRIYQSLNINYLGSDQPFMVRLNFSVYLGWISVATIANITAFLVSTGWNGGGLTEVNWTLILLGVATLLGILFIWKKKDMAYAAVLIWAFWAIRSKRLDIGHPDESIIATIILVFLGILVITAGVRFLFFNQKAP